MLDFSILQLSRLDAPLIGSVYAVLLTFVLSNVIAFTYEKTFQGLSYSRSFIQALILGSIAVSIAMQAIGDNIARGIGMFGALTLIRFRSSLRDPKDMIFIFAAMATGIATGVHAFLVAAVGALGFCLAAFAIYRSPWGRNTYFDGILRFNVENVPEASVNLEKTLAKHCSRFVLVTLRELGQGQRLEYAYQIKINRNHSADLLAQKLRGIESIRGVSLLLQESTVEL